MTKKRTTFSQSKRNASNKTSIEEKLYLMDELYRRAVQDGSLEWYRREREKGVEEVRRRWQRLRDHFLGDSSSVSR